MATYGFGINYIILKNFKKKIIAQNTEISEFVNGASRSKSHFTFKFSFLYNANYKLEALSIWWDILIENYCFLIPLVKSLIVIFIM